MKKATLCCLNSQLTNSDLRAKICIALSDAKKQPKNIIFFLIFKIPLLHIKFKTVIKRN